MTLGIGNAHLPSQQTQLLQTPQLHELIILVQLRLEPFVVEREELLNDAAVAEFAVHEQVVHEELEHGALAADEFLACVVYPGVFL